MSETNGAAIAAQGRVVIGRGPGYPALTLEAAVARANQLREANLGRATVSSLAACRVWGWGSEGGDARAALASLNHYGLMAYVGRGEQKQIQLTPLAHRIIFDRVPNSKERLAALQEAALKPTNFKKLWDKYGADLPPDFVIETYLVRDLKFSDPGARNFLAAYRPTLEYAGLLQPANIPPLNGGKVDEDPAKQEIEVGDLIQVEIDGAYALEKPDRVRAVQEHEGRRWVFVDTSETGVPMEQATLVEKGAADVKPPTIPLPKLPLKTPAAAQDALAPGVRREVFALDEGDVTLTFPEKMSAASCDDLEAYLRIFLRKAKRAAGEGPMYELRLYKRTGSNKAINEIVQRIPIDANSQDEAIEKAKDAQIPAWDNSDYAALFGPAGHELWRVEASKPN